MASLARFTQLSPSDRRLWLRALFLVVAVRASLFVLPFRTIRGLVSKMSRREPARSAPRCAWAVRSASRYVPRATCLTQALAAQALLTESGHRSSIEIGVMKDEHRRFCAHAWVICGEEIVIGAAGVDRYVPLAAWNTTIERTN